MPVVWATAAVNAMKRQSDTSMSTLSPEYIAYTNAPEILSITGTFFGLAVFVVLSRCYVRLAMLKVFGRDDYVMVLAMLFAAITYACFVNETHHGLGKHTSVLVMDAKMYEGFAKTLYVHSLTVMVGISCVKISIAFSLLRLSATQVQTRFLWGCIMFIIAITIACAGTLIFQCFPVAAAWDSSLRPAPIGTGHANCFSGTTFRNLGLMNSIFNIITDILFATLPIPLIWKLHINLRTKISLIVVLSLGWFACAAAIVKAVAQWSILSNPDWSVQDSFNVWNYIELTIGMIAASLPATKPLFNWALNTARAASSGARSKAAGRPSAYAGANSLGYHHMGSNSHKSIRLQSFHSRGDTENGTGDPYSVQVSTHNSSVQQPSGKADKDDWDIINAKDSDESVRPLGFGPKDINVTTEVRVS